MIARTLAVALLLGSGVLPGPGRAFAAPLKITPIQAELTSGAPNAILTIENLGSEPMRFQVSAFAWQQDPRGEMQLSRTKDVTFFPSLLTVGAGEKRNLRIAAATPFASVEKTYRVFVEQLPGASGGPEQGVRVLARVGIPVFLEPRKPARSAEIAALALEGRRVSFSLRNTGNVRFLPTAVRVVGRDGDGGVVFEQPLSSWYVLGGGERRFEAEAPADGCARVRTLIAEAEDRAFAVKAQLPAPGGACAP